MAARPAVRFAVTAILLVAARALDAFTTWRATPDLALETNPLVRLLHLGWAGLVVVNALVVLLLIVAAWRAAFTPPALPREAGLDFEGFVARYWFSISGRRSLRQAVLWLPADAPVRWAFLGGPGAVLVICASAVIAVWNSLVARGVVSIAAGRVGVAAFWGGIVLALFFAVRVFLVRAYARYAHATLLTAPVAAP